jgi:tetratricopeptide (TPR) repeat protein
MTQPVNPYIAGSPLGNEKGFFGRQDTLKWVSQELHNPATNALVLAGQRRIGKTTILLQLERNLSSDVFLPLYFNLQDKATLPLGCVLADLAGRVARRINWQLPDPDAFDDQGHFFQCSFLPRLYQVLESRRPVFLLDEFDVLDEPTKEELSEAAAAKALFPFLRRVMAEDLRPAFVFAVGRQAEDLSVNFAVTFKTSLRRDVWVLDRASAESLVRQAETNGTLRFTDRALERILSLTSGHPYMTQLLCQRTWERVYSNNPSELPQVDAPEVEAAIPDALDTGQQAFIWLWDGLRPAEKVYASALAEAAGENETIAEGQVIRVLATHAARLRTREVELAPRDLVKRWILEGSAQQGYRFAVELIRQWVRRNKPLREVKDELDRIDPLAEQFFELGKVFQRDQPEEASVHFRRALEANPHHLRARLGLGEALLSLNRVDEAVTELEQAHEQDEIEARWPLARALVARARALEEEGNEDRALAACARALELSPNEQTAQGIKKAIWVRRGNAAVERGDLDAALTAYRQAGAQGWEDAITFAQRALKQEPDLVRTRFHLIEILLKLGRTDEALARLKETAAEWETAPGISRQQLGEILATARNRVRLLGVVAVDADWRALARQWAAWLVDNPAFEIAILCESDNTLFAKSLIWGLSTGGTQRSFQQLQFVRDRAVVDLPDRLVEARVAAESKVAIEITHLPVPVSVVQVDERLFANFGLHSLEEHFEEIVPGHPWRLRLEAYLEVYFDTARGRKYACASDGELLEVFDHNRIPRGIVPRDSFYDTDYPQRVVWAFVFDRRGRLLIHRRSDNAKDNQGMWDKSVGGHIEFSDLDISHSAYREVIEELFVEEPEKVKSDFKKWAITDDEVIYLGDWRPGQRKRYPFEEIRSFKREWAFFRFRGSEELYSPRTMRDGTVHRLRVVPDIFLFAAGPQLTDELIGGLKNSTFRLIEPAKLKDVVDTALSGRPIPGFDENRSGKGEPVPRFTPDLTAIMTGKLFGVLEEFSAYLGDTFRDIAG